MSNKADDQEMGNAPSMSMFANRADYDAALEKLAAQTGGEAVAPEARADVLKQLRAAMDVVSALCDGSMRWTMSVPARPDSDPDLVISSALHAAEKLIAIALPAPPAPLPDILFDGYAVYQALSDKAKARTSADNVADVLDAMVKLSRAAPPALEAAPDQTNALRMALACIRWQVFGECRTAGWDGPPPRPSDTEQALVAALSALEAAPGDAPDAAEALRLAYALEVPQRDTGPSDRVLMREASRLLKDFVAALSAQAAPAEEKEQIK